MITLPSGRKIGPGEKTFIIAEVGSNWRDLNDCRHSIAMAKAAGADAVKFQAFDWNALYGSEGLAPHGLRANAFVDGRLPLDWLPHLKEKADKAGIEFMCSAFSPELYEAVNPYVNLHKVASAEMTHVRILQKLREIGKPVILSTGASGEEDINAAVSFLHGQRSQHVKACETILLYCVAAYPAYDINFRVMENLATRFKADVGFSDHTTDYSIIPAEAVRRGACVIEKHFTDIPEVDTPDRPHSLTVTQFKAMVDRIRNGEPDRIGYTGEETPMVLRHNRRLIAIRDIAVNDRFVEGENFGIYRALHDDPKGISPFAVDHVNGKMAAAALKAGEGIGPKDFK